MSFKRCNFHQISNLFYDKIARQKGFIFENKTLFDFVKYKHMLLFKIPNTNNCIETFLNNVTKTRRCKKFL